MLHSIFHSGDHMLVPEIPRDGIASQEALDDDTMGEETLDGDDSMMEQELTADDEDTVENTDSTNIPLSTKKFWCEDCGKYFTTNKTLRRHIRKIHNRAPEPICTSNSIVQQKKSSVGRVCCSDCNVWFSANKNLLRHIRTSTTHRQRVEQKMKEATTPLVPLIHNIILENVTENIVDCTPKVEIDVDEQFPAHTNVSNVDVVDEKPTFLMNHHEVDEMNSSERFLDSMNPEETDENIADSDADDTPESVEPETTSGLETTVETVCSPEQLAQQKKYPCEECGQQFTKKSNVYRHMRRIHHIFVDLQQKSNKETVAIPVVQEASTNTTQLVNKRFACDKCDQSYTKKCNLQRHIRNVHNKPALDVLNSDRVKNIKCDHCVQLFARRSSLLRHMRRKHLAKYSASLAASKMKIKSQKLATTMTTTPNEIEPFLMVDKNLRLSDYPFLKNMLPAAYDYNLKFYAAITEKDIPFKCFTATIQFHCSTVGETKYWVTLFERTNKLSFKCVNVHAPGNDENCSRMQYRCAEEGCPAVLSIATNAANVQRRNLLRVTVRIVHKHNHKWDPPRLDLSQLVEAVIEEQDLMDEESEDQSSSLDGNQISVVADSGYYATTNATQDQQQQQQPVMTFYFNKFGNSYVTQNVSFLANGHHSNALSELVLVDENASKLEKVAGGERVVENGEYDAISQFKRVCGDITVMIEQDPKFFAQAVQEFETSFDRICNSKSDLWRALREFGKNDEDMQDAYEGTES